MLSFWNLKVQLFGFLGTHITRHPVLFELPPLLRGNAPKGEEELACCDMASKMPSNITCQKRDIYSLQSPNENHILTRTSPEVVHS